MTGLQFALIIGGMCGIGSVLLAIHKVLDQLLRAVNDLRLEHMQATGVEPAGMMRAREANALRRWEDENPIK